MNGYDNGGIAPGAIIAVYLIVGTVFGVVTMAIANSRGISQGRGWGWFFVGLLLGIIGVLIACVMQPAAQPPGWYADPWMQAPMRYWSGSAWTHHVHSGAGSPETTKDASPTTW